MLSDCCTERPVAKARANECQIAKGAASRDLAARMRPSFAGSKGLPGKGGRRECRMLGAPAAARAL